MSDTILKSKAQLRPISVIGSNGNSNGVSPTAGDKTPTTPSKLLINHGKPNFTIQRSPKAQQNGDENPLMHELQANKNNNYNPYKKAESQTHKANNNIIISTKFNGAFKPANVPITQKQPHQNGHADENDNEAAKVVLRRAKVAETLPQNGGNSNGENHNDDNDDAVPEFIKRQRRIQERLAKENILDFENRRSGYFTHVVITPTSPNRQSLVETMTSPAVMPALEMPPPVPTSPTPLTAMATMHEEHFEATEAPQLASEHETITINQHTNGHDHDDHKQTQAEEEEVAKAIEEVNKAVAGEDDDKSNELKEQTNFNEAHNHEEFSEPSQVPVLSAWHPVDPPAEFQNQTTSDAVAVEPISEPALAHAVATMEITETVEADSTPASATSPTSLPPTPVNAQVEVVEVHAAPQENGHIHHDDVSISHTNGSAGPSIPAPDPSGALGVNYEPKTVVSFSKDLGSEPNNYPDKVKIINENGEANAEKPINNNEELQGIAKLKFDIKTDEHDVQVTPVLRHD